MTADNPLLNAGHIYQVLLFIGALVGVVGVFLKWMKDRRKEDLDSIKQQRDADVATHAGTHALIDARFTNVEHKLNNAAQAITALEGRDSNKEVRLAKLELSLDTFREGQQRIEGAQAALRHDINERLDDIVESIREIRTVGPK